MIITLLQFLFVLLVSANAYSQQIFFSEDFDGIQGNTTGGAGTYIFPAGWSLFNVDTLTPVAFLNYCNDAWIRQVNLYYYTVTNDTAAMSVSDYTPSGNAEDWMWTPPVQITVNSDLI